uniref:hypothetical protein n=1 Tax=Flavobacterium sp. TaxID=239 RepID=UPI004049BF6D
MKKLFFIFLTALALMSCDKDDDVPTNPVDQLPPATQTGAGTFGCLVNGVPFVDNSGFFNCFYQLVNGEYYFGIRGRQESFIRQIVIGSEKKNIDINVSLTLKSRNEGNFWANVSFDDCSTCLNANTTDQNPGIITFTKLDFQNNIVSATFEFTVIDPNTGTIYEITEGRFDSFFTQ